MNRSSVSSPPWSGSGALRTCSGADGFVTVAMGLILFGCHHAAPMADRQRSLAERLLAGDKRALARGISLVEDDDPEGWELVREVYPHTGNASIVGFTGAPGGLAEAALQTALLMDAAGRDDVFLETVGVGQAEVDVIDHADTVVLVLIPGSGDSIQALKAGVMEIPDVIVVNKADHPLTDTMVREIRGVLSLAPP